MLIKKLFNRHTSAALVVALLSPTLFFMPAAYSHAQVYRPVPRVVLVDRTRLGWWRGHPDFIGYHGPRRRHYFAPGYGYYLPPRGVYGLRWVAGVALPVPMRQYVVVDPLIYGLRRPAPGYRWYYAGDRIVLAAVATGIIVESVLAGW
ncbi:RcnB family protein [Sphingomonas sp. QA11]|uniref:RcnB family protein n=1 Tax=Sphingomonas sp. QA11 TaxID=2950605 RepID=UPI0023496892|nr:RcnB family protein [Sphingomonas sp. QA11]WCM27414.1 RcnB family protein [Sphingomonas sp. QA11]